ncbi:MAG: hypothetical protein R3F49_15890 [Planctomycetota bacterium]
MRAGQGAARATDVRVAPPVFACLLGAAAWGLAGCAEEAAPRPGVVPAPGPAPVTAADAPMVGAASATSTVQGTGQGTGQATGTAAADRAMGAAPLRPILRERLAAAQALRDVSDHFVPTDAAASGDPIELTPLSEAPPALAALAPEERELLEFVRAMTDQLAADASAFEAVQRDIAAEGAATLRALVTVALDPSASDGARRAAVDLLPATGSGDAARALLHVANRAPEAWVRQFAVWRARETAALDGADGALVGLLLRLKYEKDPEALVWLSGSLAAFGDLAGVERLMELAAGTTPAAAAAAGELTRVAEPFGVDAATLAAGWLDGALPAVARSAEGAAAPPPLSPALRDAVWRSVSELSGAHFQLRGVDDARYALARLPARAIPELALALEDEDPFVRLHVAQVLERMGPRARCAITALTTRLDDAHAGVAGAAAEALGAVLAEGSAVSTEQAGQRARPRAVGGLHGRGDAARAARRGRSEPRAAGRWGASANADRAGPRDRGTRRSTHGGGRGRAGGG